MFGLGYVSEILGLNKIEAIFQEGPKFLVQNRSDLKIKIPAAAKKKLLKEAEHRRQALEAAVRSVAASGNKKRGKRVTALDIREKRQQFAKTRAGLPSAIEQAKPAQKQKIKSPSPSKAGTEPSKK